MKIHCSRPIITDTGVCEISFIFDTETLDVEFDEKDYPILMQIFQKTAFDIPDMTKYGVSK